MSSLYLHLGGDAVIAAMDVVTIVDARVVGAAANKRFLEQAVTIGPFEVTALRKCKALVVTTRGVYASSVSPQGLARRLEETAL